MKKGFTLIELMIVIAIIAIIAAIAIPNLLASKIATNETAAVQNLKSIATAQSQYTKKFDAYSASGKELNTTGAGSAINLIAPDLSGAFESYQGNADATATPKAGYDYRMLQGETALPTGWWKTVAGTAAPANGMLTWAAMNRAAEPATTGENQFYTSEAGTVYKKAEPLVGATGYKTFLLAGTPLNGQTTWATAK